MGKHEAPQTKPLASKVTRKVGKWTMSHTIHLAHIVSLHVAALVLINKGSMLIPFLAH